MTLEIRTVNWNQKQTDIWLHHVRKHHPEAEVVLTENVRPVKWSWSSPKISCIGGHRSGHDMVYMDTDTILTGRLDPIFERMEAEGCMLAASSAIPALTGLGRRWREHPNIREINRSVGLGPRETPTHFSSGLLCFGRGLCPKTFADRWLTTMEHGTVYHYLNKHRLFEEIAMSYVIAEWRIKVWDQPLGVHGNILSRQKHFGDVEIPLVIHYHKPARLHQVKLEGFLKDVHIEKR